MADWSPDTRNLVGFWKRLEARRQNRLADFVRPHHQPDERIVAIHPMLFERFTGGGTAGFVAVVVTNQRLIVIRRGTMTGRPKKILVAYPLDGLKVEWNRNARTIPGPYFRRIDEWAGKLNVTGPFGSKELWAGGRRQDQAEAIVKTLEDD
jgi:hypothetical protein